MRLAPPAATTPPPAEGRATRVAWLASFLITLSVITVLLLAKSAQAASLPLPPVLGGGSGTLVVPGTEELEGDESEFEGDEEEFEVEECEEGEEEAEEEACEEDADAPPECVLGSADALVSAKVDAGKLRLDVRYTTFSPAAVAVEYRLRGGKGQLNLGQETKRFGRDGVLHQTDSPSKGQMAKVAAAREFTVELHAVNSPRYCRDLYERHLTLRRHAPGGFVWLDPESSFRPRR